MSTYLYLACKDHDPVLIADRESGQHMYDLREIREDYRDRDVLVPRFEQGSLSPTYFSRATLRFLSKHQNCNVTIMDEYGDGYPIAPDDFSDTTPLVVQH